MGFEYRQRMPKAEDILKEMPVTDDLRKIKEGRDKAIIDVFERKSDKFLLIIGPCSADDVDAVYEYVTRLAKLQEKVKDRLILIPRIYTNKPRTTGKGYKGMLHQPDPTEAPNIVEGVKALRKMHLKVLEISGLTVADEMLYPDNYAYLEDLLSYVAIGARSVENQQHRLTVSGLNIPVGMKNPTSGDFNVMLNSVQAAQMSHIFVYNGWEVKTDGNPYIHCILRGAFNKYCQNVPNYHFEDLKKLADMYAERELANPTVIIDASHANSNKDYRQQPRIAMEIIHSMRSSKTLYSLVRGLMIESYLEEGAQKPGGGTFGQSITDSCLGWEQSEELVLKIADYVGV